MTDERYVSRKEMAQIMGISTDKLDDFVKAGMPSHTWGTRRRFFDPVVALRWAKKRELAGRGAE